MTLQWFLFDQTKPKRIHFAICVMFVCVAVVLANQRTLCLNLFLVDSMVLTNFLCAANCSTFLLYSGRNIVLVANCNISVPVHRKLKDSAFLAENSSELKSY